MPIYKLEINFEADNESDAMDIESDCFGIVKDAVGSRKIFLDMVFEIPEEDKEV